MMLPTHIMTGLVAILPIFYAFPSYSSVIFVAGLVGFSLPDLDILIGSHRKTLHYPVLYLPVAIASFLLVINLVDIWTIIAFTVSLGCFMHSISDIIAGSLEDEPWEAEKDKVVYNHIKKEWFSARRWIPYDGSPTDVLVMIASALVFVTLYPLEMKKPLFTVILVLSFIGIIYSVLRKTLFSPVYMEENYPKLKSLNDRIRGKD